MDKAYTLMYSLDKRGIAAGNIFTDYESIETFQESLNLPISKYNKIKIASTTSLNTNGDFENDEDEEEIPSDTLVDNLLEEINLLLESTFESLNDIANYIEQDHSVSKYSAIKSIIEILNKHSDTVYTASKISDAFARLFNAYNNEGQSSTKNRIVQGIISLSEDLKNLEASEQPMEAKPVTSTISKVYEYSGKTEDLYYDELDPFTLYKIQRANSIGKTDVGIAANGIKAAGALQLYYNNIFNSSEITTENIGLSNKATISNGGVNLKFNISDANGNITRSINQAFCKIANTKISKDKYLALFTNMINKTFNGNIELHPDYELFESLQEGITPNRKLTVHESKFIRIFNTYQQEFNTKPGSLAELSYYGLNFEDNVADYISIFISLSTDNAKELALEKIHGTPELLSLPLAMITLGMDIESVIDICVNILDKVHEKLASNRFYDAKHKNVRKVIQSLRGKEIDDDTCNSLLFIYDFALELRSITSFFKVNLGVSTKYAELKSFITNISNDRLTKAQNKFGKKQSSTSQITTVLWKALELPADFSYLFTDENYAKAITDLYELSKTVFNVMDVILNSPHFKLLLQSTAEILQVCEGISGKAKISQKLLGNEAIVNDNGEIEYNEIMADKVDLSKVRSVNDLQALHSKILRLVDSWVITEFLQKNEELRFSVAELNQAYNNNFSHLSNHDFIRLDSEFGINQFISLVNNVIIPELRSQFDGNFFLESLELKSVKQNKDLIYYDLKFDPYAMKDNPTISANFNAAQAEFNVIKNKPLPMRTISGHNLTVGELFYIYSTITGRGLTTALSTVSHEVDLNKDIFKITIDKIYTELDSKAQENKQIEDLIEEIQKNLNIYRTNNPNVNETTDPIILNYLKSIKELKNNNAYNYILNVVNNLAPFAKALATTGNVIAIHSDLQNKDSLSFDLDTTKSFIITSSNIKILSISVPLNGKCSNLENLIKILCPYATPRVNAEYNKDSNSIIITCDVTVSNLEGDKSDRIIKKIEITNLDKLPKSNNLITLNAQTTSSYLAETVLAILDSYLYALDNGLNEIIEGTLENILESSLKSGLSEFETEPKTKQNISNFINEEKKIIITNQGVSRVRKIGDDTVIILNSEEIAGYLDDDKARLLLDLYLESKDIKAYTQKGKVLVLLLEAAPDKNVTYDNMTEVLKEMFSTNQKLENKYYIEQLIYNNITKDYVKRESQKALIEMLYALKDINFYYELVLRELPKDNILEKGDICLNRENELCLYIGTTPKGEHMFVNISKTNINEPIFKIELDPFILDDNGNSYRLLKKLMITSGLFTGKPNKSNFSYKLDRINVTVEKVKRGDLFTINDNEYLVVSKCSGYVNKESDSPKLIKKILLVNTKTGYSIVLVAQKNNKSNKTIYKDLNSKFLIDSTTLLDVLPAITPTTINSLNVYTINLEKSSLRNKIKLAQNLKVGDTFNVKGVEDIYTFKLFNTKANTLITSSDLEIPLDDIISISIDEYFDPDINEITSNKSFIVVNNSNYEENDKDDKHFPVSWRPSLNDGYTLLKVSGYNNMRELTPVDGFAGNTYLRKLYLLGYTKEERIPKEGDIIIDRDLNHPEQVIVKKIINKTGLNYEILSYTLVNGKSPEIRMYEVSNMISLKVYTKKPAYKSFRQNSENVSLEDKSKKLLELLEQKTGMPIEFVNDVEEWVAKVLNGKIMFNTKKVNEDNVASLAAHEFTHIVLANIRSQNPTLYAEFISRVMNTNEFLQNENSSEWILKSKSELAEEIIVNKVEKIVKEVFTNAKDSYEYLDITDTIFKTLSNILNIKIEGSKRNTSIESLFNKKRFESNYIEHINLNEIENSLIKHQVFDEIIASKNCE